MAAQKASVRFQKFFFPWIFQHSQSKIYFFQEHKYEKLLGPGWWLVSRTWFRIKFSTEIIHQWQEQKVPCGKVQASKCNLKTYFGSTLAVASSRTKILFFFKIALAKQTNCLCPTDKLDPPSFIFTSKPSLNSSIALVNWAWSSALQILESLYSSKGSKFFLRLDANKRGSEKIIFYEFKHFFWKNRSKHTKNLLG